MKIARAAFIAAISIGSFACAGETPTSVFATGDVRDPADKRGSLFSRMKLAYEHVRPKPPPPGPQAAPPKLDEAVLRSIVETRAFRLGAPTMMTPTPDGQAVLFLRSGARDTRQSLFKLDVTKGTLHELVTPERLSGAENLTAEERALRERMRTRGTGITSFELTSDGLAIIIPYAGRIHVFDRMTGLVRQLPTSDGVVDVHASPDGKRVAYVHDHDLYVCEIDGKTTETRLTRGGTEHTSHGLAEFIAAEEFERTRGFFFSPDSQQIAYEEVDQTQVERLTIANLAHPEQAPDRPYYPRAGHSNASVRFGIMSVRGGPTTWVKWDREKFPYVAQVRWEDGPLVMYVLDREQKNGQLLLVDPRTGKTTPIVIEHDDVFLEIDPSVPRFLADGKRFYWSTERDGELRLELRSIDAPPSRDGTYVTPKGFGYRELLDVDEARSRVMVEASAEPAESGLFAVPLAGGEPQPIGTHPGTVHARFGRSHDLYASYEANTTHYPSYFAVTVDGKRTAIPHLSERPPFEPNVEILRVGPEQVRVAVIRPRNFVKGSRAPVIDAAYGGPHAVVAVADAIRHARSQFIADATGAIVVAIDAKGTPYRTREWSRAIYGKLGEVPVQGHIDVLKELAKQIPEMDLSRVGVFGWSYGGYFAGYAVLKHPTIYKVGVAGAPVADWRDYDTAYAERYLGLPGTNGQAYDENSLFVAARKTTTPRPLLLIHGTADDNVYFTSSLKLANTMTEAHLPVEFLPLVDQTHLVSTPEQAFIAWRKTAEFLRDHLQGEGAVAPEDLNPYRPYVDIPPTRL